MRQAFDLITSPLNNTNILENVRGFFSGRGEGSESEGLGGKMLSMLFGSDQSRVAAGVSEASGLRPTSAATVMGIAAPIVLGALGKRVKDEHLDSSGLSKFLQTETSEVRNILPASLMSSVDSSASGSPGIVGQSVTDTTRNIGRWLWPLLLLALLIGALLWAFNRGLVPVSNAVQSTVRSLGDLYHRALPNGVDLNIPKLGMESQLLAFIEDKSKPADNTTWFEFDRLSFDINSTTLRPESLEQVNNIAAILKAYPNTHVKIGGYTDNTGDPNANMQLSQQRADSVMQQLIALGIAPDRLTAQGFGEQYPIADNSTPEGRARNRRFALNVTQK
jgi:outer membrane protein OmpA-like peptidoglycan-associated protein